MIARMWETKISPGQLDEFCDWVKAAYAQMPSPPSPVDEVPDVVRLSFDQLVTAGEELSPSSLS